MEKQNLFKKFIYSQKTAPYVFLLPFAISFLVFFAYSIFDTFVMSFQRVAGGNTEFIGLKNYQVLKFIMQPIVENCIKHGFKGLKRTGYIHIQIYVENQKLYFLTEDNGMGIPREKLEQLTEYMKDMADRELDCIGLKNTFQRLKLTYGDEAGIDICSVENEGTKVYCYIPFSQEEYNV